MTARISLSLVRTILGVSVVGAMLGGCPVSPSSDSSGDGAQSGDGQNTDTTAGDNNTGGGTTTGGGGIIPDPDDTGTDTGGGTGDDNDPPLTDDSVPIAGTFSGTLDCTHTQSLSGAASTPTFDTMDLSITFDADGRPTILELPGFLSNGTSEVTLSRIGETDTLKSTSGASAITQVFTVTQAFYTRSSIRIVIGVDLTASGGSLRQEGTGTVTIKGTVVGDTMNYSVVADYDVMFITDTINIDTGELIECSGPLSRQ